MVVNLLESMHRYIKGFYSIEHCVFCQPVIYNYLLLFMCVCVCFVLILILFLYVFFVFCFCVCVCARARAGVCAIDWLVCWVAAIILVSYAASVPVDTETWTSDPGAVCSLRAFRLAAQYHISNLKSGSSVEGEHQTGGQHQSLARAEENVATLLAAIEHNSQPSLVLVSLSSFQAFSCAMHSTLCFALYFLSTSWAHGFMLVWLQWEDVIDCLGCCLSFLSSLSPR